MLFGGIGGGQYTFGHQYFFKGRQPAFKVIARWVQRVVSFGFRNGRDEALLKLMPLVLSIFSERHGDGERTTFPLFVKYQLTVPAR